MKLQSNDRDLLLTVPRPEFEISDDGGELMMRSTNILFLDFDGVLNTSEDLERGELFAQANVAALNDIMDHTDAHIVVTSMWRLGATPEELEDMLLGAGVHAAGRVIGTTPSLEESPRGAEIKAWMERAPVRVEDFVILDNRDDMATFIPHLVQTDPQSGLLQDQVAQVVNRLGPTLVETA